MALPTSPAYRAPQELEAAEKKQRARRDHDELSWTAYYDDKCFVPVQEKIKGGYYPQENGDKKPLSKWHRRHPGPEQRRKFGAVRTRPEREGSEKTQPDGGALQRQIQERLDEKQQTLERDEKTREELANYQTTIGRMREEIHGLRRTVAGSGFSIARLRNEMDTKKPANEELEHRNHSLRKELRRAGQRLLDLGV